MIFYNETSEFWFWSYLRRGIEISDDKRIKYEDYYLMMDDIEKHWWIHCYLRNSSAKYRWCWYPFDV